MQGRNPTLRLSLESDLLEHEADLESTCRHFWTEDRGCSADLDISGIGTALVRRKKASAGAQHIGSLSWLCRLHKQVTQPRTFVGIKEARAPAVHERSKSTQWHTSQHRRDLAMRKGPFKIVILGEVPRDMRCAQGSSGPSGEDVSTPSIRRPILQRPRGRPKLLGFLSVRPPPKVRHTSTR